MNSFSWATLPAFIVAIVILVGVHEFGHFWVARRLGIRVLRFAIGFGKPIWKRVSPKDGVEYVIGSIPLGGYVKLLDEREGNVDPADAPYGFTRAPVWKRVLVLLAGPFVNLIFAALVYWMLLQIGIPALKPVIGEVVPDSIAAQSGLQSGDLITAVQGHAIATRDDAVVYVFDQLVEGSVQLTVRGHEGSDTARDVILNDREQHNVADAGLTDPGKMMAALGFEFWMPNGPAFIEQVTPGGSAERAGLHQGDEVREIDGQLIADPATLVKVIESRANRTVNISIQRAGATMVLPITIAEQISEGHGVGKIGVAISRGPMPEAMRATQKYGLIASANHAIAMTWNGCVLDLKVMWQIVTGKMSVKNLSGAVGIAEVTGEAARQGPLTFLSLLAFISINLAILNLLPIPILDGGQVVYQLVELVKGSPVSERIQLISQQVGFAVLMMLVSLTLYNDIARHLS